MKKIHTFLGALSIAAVLLFAVHAYQQVSASTTDNLSGWAWSDTIGWISFNNTSDGSSVPYGVTRDDNGNVSGHAWSDNIGWISFNRTETGNPPSGDVGGGSGAIAKFSGNALTGWARALSGVGPAAQDAATAAAAGTWIAYTNPGYENVRLYLAKVPPTTHTVAGKTFNIYDPIRLYTGSFATFQQNPEQAIKNAMVLPIGQGRDQRLIFNKAQLDAEPAATQGATIEGFRSFVANRFQCTTNEVNAPTCHANNAGAYNIGISYGPYNISNQIYLSYSDSDSGTTFTPATTVGTYTVGSIIDNRGGWDGWISLSGTSPSYGITLNPTTRMYRGYAWGSDVVGWVNFNPFDTDGDGDVDGDDTPAIVGGGTGSGGGPDGCTTNCGGVLDNTPPSMIASCSVSNATPSINGSVTWTAGQTNGTAPYTYSWNGGAYGTANTFSRVFKATDQSFQPTLSVKDSSTPEPKTASPSPACPTATVAVADAMSVRLTGKPEAAANANFSANTFTVRYAKAAILKAEVNNSDTLTTLCRITGRTSAGEVFELIPVTNLQNTYTTQNLGNEGSPYTYTLSCTDKNNSTAKTSSVIIKGSNNPNFNEF